MSRSETPAHLQLKQLAARWAHKQGFPICAFEISLPRCGYRADVVATTLHVDRPEARVATFECKQSRADCLRDSAQELSTRRNARQIEERLQNLRQLIAGHRPDLRRGESLFAEYDAYDYTGLRHDTLETLEGQLRTLQHQLGTAVKFDRLFRYGVSDFFYLVTEENVVADYEVPVSWGWLCRDGPQLALRKCPVLAQCNAEVRLRLVERIAVKTTREINRLWLHDETFPQACEFPDCSRP